MIQYEWSYFKAFVDKKALSIQWVEDENFYYLAAVDGYFSIRCTLNKKNLNEALCDFEKNYKALGNMPSPMLVTPWASKTLGTKKLFKRVRGIRQDVTEGSSTINWSSPYAWAKFTSVEIVGATAGDTCDFWVTDSATGLVSGFPNAPLNQFGFLVNLAENFYEQRSEFDADIYAGMNIQIIYNSVDSKSIGINFVMNEVKS